MPARTRSAPPTESPGEPEDTGGYFRNTGGLALTVLGRETRVIEPGRIEPLPDEPYHRDLQRVGEDEYAAQQAADAAAEPAGSEPMAESTEKEA